MKHITSLFAVLLLALLALPVMAQETEEVTELAAPTCGTISDVNGLTSVYFLGNMWQAGNPDKPNPLLVAKAYAARDSETGIWYIGVLLTEESRTNGIVLNEKPDDQWVKFNDGTKTTKVADGKTDGFTMVDNFAWFVPFEFDTTDLDSLIISVHISWTGPGYDEDETGALVPIETSTTCKIATAISLASFGVAQKESTTTETIMTGITAIVVAICITYIVVAVINKKER